MQVESWVHGPRRSSVLGDFIEKAAHKWGLELAESENGERIAQIKRLGNTKTKKEGRKWCKRKYSLRMGLREKKWERLAGTGWEMASYIQKKNNKANKILTLYCWFPVVYSFSDFVFAFYSWFWEALSPLGICCEKTQGLLQRKTCRHSFCILAHPWTWTLSYRPLVNTARRGCIIEAGSNMIKSISSASEHWQECGECVGSDESRVRGNKTLLQCFSQEMKVCSVVPANICF